MGWGGGGKKRAKTGGRGGAYLVNPSVHQIKGATLSKNSAIAEYGISAADLDGVPCTWRSCHGNSYPLYERSDVLAVVAGKKAKDPSYASAAKASADKKELAEARSNLREATAKLEELERLCATGGYLGLTGVNANIAERLPKTDSKRLYCLDDADLRGLSVTFGRGMMGNCSENYLPEELLTAAEAKHGGAAGFLERRRKQQQRTNKKDLAEWAAKKASAQSAVRRLEPAPDSSRPTSGKSLKKSAATSDSTPTTGAGPSRLHIAGSSDGASKSKPGTSKSAFSVLMARDTAKREREDADYVP